MIRVISKKSKIVWGNGGKLKRTSVIIIRIWFVGQVLLSMDMRRESSLRMEK